MLDAIEREGYRLRAGYPECKGAPAVLRGCRLALERLVNKDFRTASSFFAPRNLPLLFRLKALVNHYDHMSAFFDNPRLKAAFTFQDVYRGLSPFEV